MVKRCRQVVGMIGMIKSLSMEQVRQAIPLGIEGTIGYYGRAVLIRREECDDIENAIREVLATRGWGAGGGAHLLSEGG